MTVQDREFTFVGQESRPLPPRRPEGALTAEHLSLIWRGLYSSSDQLAGTQPPVPAPDPGDRNRRA